MTQTDYPQRIFPQPRWDGSDLAGRAILLYAEQGLGDTLQFIRYAPLVRERGGKVIVECQPQLAELLRGAAGVDQVIAQGSALPAFAVQVPLLSLPAIFHTTLQNIPAAVPYLRLDAELVQRWGRELPRRGGLQIGIAWQGNPRHLLDQRRSIALSQFAPLAKVEGVQLVSLQHGPGAEQIRAVADKFHVTDLASKLGNAARTMLDIAAVIKNLDLVITCDTAIAHLAGALGVQVWVALPLAPDWRWLLQREDSPWYPTMRLFRQTRRRRMARCIHTHVPDFGGNNNHEKHEIHERKPRPGLRLARDFLTFFFVFLVCFVVQIAGAPLLAGET